MKSNRSQCGLLIYSALLVLVLRREWERGNFDIKKLKKLSRNSTTPPTEADFDQLWRMLA